MRAELRLLAASAAALALLAGGCGGHGHTFTIGVITDCEGVFSAYSEASIAGAELPLLERGGKLAAKKPSDGIAAAKVGGRRVELRLGCGEVTYLTQLIEYTRRLVEEDGADVVVAPMLGQTEGVVLRDLAHRYPRVAFLLGLSTAQEPTLRDRAPNLFRFVADGAQSAAGLGSYAFNDLGWRTAAVVLPDSGFAWPQAAGFVAEFCALGGHVQRIAAPPFAAAGAVPRLPENADGVALMVQAFPDVAGFAAAYAKVKPDLARHLVLGPAALDFLDPKLFAGSAPLLRNVVVSGATAFQSQEPAWLAFRRAFLEHFPGLDRPTSPAAVPLVLAFYDSVEATLRALERAGGSRSAFMSELANTTLDSPGGPVRLDGNHQAIVSTYLSQIAVAANGTPSIRTLRVLKDVEQTFAGYFGPSTPTPTVSRPGCHVGTPPPWAG